MKKNYHQFSEIRISFLFELLKPGDTFDTTTINQFVGKTPEYRKRQHKVTTDSSDNGATSIGNFTHFLSVIFYMPSPPPILRGAMISRIPRFVSATPKTGFDTINVRFSVFLHASPSHSNPRGARGEVKHSRECPDSFQRFRNIRISHNICYFQMLPLPVFTRRSVRRAVK